MKYAVLRRRPTSYELLYRYLYQF